MKKKPSIVMYTESDGIEGLYTNEAQIVSAFSNGWLARESYEQYDAYSDKLGVIVILDSRIDAFDRPPIKLQRDIITPFNSENKNRRCNRPKRGCISFGKRRHYIS
jgi:hypothetical protein